MEKTKEFLLIASLLVIAAFLILSQLLY